MDAHATWLKHILDAIAGVRAVVGDASFEEYQGNRAMRRATERELEIISEASRHLPQTMKDAAPDVPWRAVADIGDKLRHEYFRIEDSTIWSTARFDLDLLESACRDELNRLERLD